MAVVKYDYTFQATGNGIANYSKPFDVTSVMIASIHVKASVSVGAIAGAIKLQCSNDTDFGWVDVPAAQGAVVTGSISGAGIFMLTTGSSQASYSLLRVVVTPSNTEPIDISLKGFGKA